jgi:hypothetical protein
MDKGCAKRPVIDRYIAVKQLIWQGRTGQEQLAGCPCIVAKQAIKQIHQGSSWDAGNQDIHPRFAVQTLGRSD